MSFKTLKMSLHLSYLSRIIRKPVFGASDQVQQKQAQKMASGFKFQIKEVEGLYYLCSEKTKALTEQLICAFAFAYAKSRFSHDATFYFHHFRVF